MSNKRDKELDVIKEKVLKLYNEDVETDDIASQLNISLALVEVILIDEYRIMFR